MPHTIFPPVGFNDKGFSIESDCSRESGDDRERYGHSSDCIRNRVGVREIWNDPQRRRQTPKHVRLDGTSVHTWGRISGVKWNDNGT